jgi:hypothetical protein
MSGKRITKDQISAPSPLIQPPKFQLADRGGSRTSSAARSSEPEKKTTLSPFTAGRFDVSASVAGGMHNSHRSR